MKHITVIVVLALLTACGTDKSRSGFDAEKYIQEVENFRNSKDDLFTNSDSSPLTEDAKNEFSGLNYFPVSLKFRILADFLPVANAAVINIAMNDGTVERYLKYGYASFQLDSQAVSLLVLKPAAAQHNSLFVPFFDGTNGYDTYGGGRYLEPRQISEQKILLDFNYAYNPYCVYSEKYVCPLPPQENRIPASIEAGEKNLVKEN